MRLFRRDPDEDGLAQRMRQTADLFVETAGRFGVVFDYSESSVPQLEAWVDHLWDPAGPRPSAAELDSNTQLAGAYLGEVMIRNVGGHWVMARDPRQPAVNLDGVIAFVLGKVYKRQVNGRADSIVDFYQGFRRIAQERRASGGTTTARPD